MKFVNKTEIKIFLTFFFIYSLFIFWIGWNEQSRFALVRSVVDEGRFEINSFANQTSDRALYNNNYYSDKEPGSSFLSVPAYSSWEFIYYNFFLKSFIEKNEGEKSFFTTYVGTNKIPIIDYINPGFFILTAMLLVTIFASSIFGALLIVLVYKISGYFTNQESHRLLLVFTAGLGTLIFPYSITYFEFSSATFFAFLAFYLLIKLKQEKINDQKYIFLAGILIGFGMVCHIIVSLIALAFFFYLFSIRREVSMKSSFGLYILGCFIGLLPLLIYNQTIFVSPFNLSRMFLDKEIYEASGTPLPFGSNPFILLRVLIYPYRGIFFYHPILLLSFFGIYRMYKRFKVEALLILFIFLEFIALNSFPKLPVMDKIIFGNIFGGANFGMRQFMSVVPFLGLPLLFVFKDKSKGIKIFSLILVIISIFINFIGLQPVRDEMISEDKIHVAPEYANKINSLEIIKNPLDEYYLPLFFQYGPRSRILENLVNGQIPIDIRYLTYEQSEAFRYFYYCIPFLSLIPVALTLFLFWRKEVKAKYPKLYTNIFISCVILGFLIFVYYLSDFYLNIKTLNFEKEFYPYSPEEGNWMRNDGIIIVNNPSDFKKNITFFSNLTSYNQNRKIELYLNNRLIDDFVVYKNQELNYFSSLELIPGKNMVKIHSDVECDIPNLVEKTEDKRCLSILSNNMSIIDFKIPSETILFYRYWHPQSPVETGRWMLNNGTILLYNPENISKAINFSTSMSSYLIDRKVEIFLNEKMLENIISYADQDVKYDFLFNLTPGYNKLIFYTPSDCYVPMHKENKSDTRCLSIKFSNYAFQSFKEGDETQLFYRYWHPQSALETGRWMLNNGTILLYNPENISKPFKLSTIISSYLVNRDLDIYLNDKIKDRVKTFYDQELEYALTFDIKPGYNKILFYSPTDCQVPNKVEKTEDKRCLSIKFANFALVPYDYTKNDTMIFSKYWHPQSALEAGRWMLNNGAILLYNLTEEKPIQLKIIGWSIFKNRSVDVNINNKFIETFVFPSTYGIDVVTSPFIPLKENLIIFHSSEECNIPAKMPNGWDDKRCLNINVFNISIAR